MTTKEGTKKIMMALDISDATNLTRVLVLDKEEYDVMLEALESATDFYRETLMDMSPGDFGYDSAQRHQDVLEHLVNMLVGKEV